MQGLYWNRGESLRCPLLPATSKSVVVCLVSSEPASAFPEASDALKTSQFGSASSPSAISYPMIGEACGIS